MWKEGKIKELLDNWKSIYKKKGGVCVVGLCVKILYERECVVKFCMKKGICENYERKKRVLNVCGIYEKIIWKIM